VHDDVANLLFVLDLPDAVQPLPDGNKLGLGYALPGPLKVGLVRADAGELAGTLPPPAAGRTYHLFEIAPAERAAIVQAQAASRGAAPVGTGLALEPRLCATGAVDPAKVQISMLVAAAGQAAISPPLRNQVLASLVGPSLPPCTM